MPFTDQSLTGLYPVVIIIINHHYHRYLQLESKHLLKT